MQLHQPSRQVYVMAMAASLASAMLYGLAASGAFFSLLINYLPLLPLLMCGLAFGGRMAIIAALSGTLLAGILAGLPGMSSYALLYAIPTAFFTHIALLVTPDGRQWFPLGGAMTALCLYAAAVAGLLVMVMLEDGSSLLAMLPDGGENPSAMLVQARQLLEKAPFLVFALGGWMQILMFYAVAVLAHFALEGWQPCPRPHLRITPFMPSLFVLAALLLAGMLSFSEAFNVQMAGKTAFLILLLPYFLMGVARLHLRARRWTHPRLWLFGIYLFTALAFWPVFWFIGAGLFAQAKFLSNRNLSGTDH